MTTTLTEAQATLMSQRIFAWLDHLDAISPEGYSYTCDTPGKRFVRIIMNIGGNRNSVHAFYEPSTGNVYKAAGYKAPAKHVRYNLLDDSSFTRMIEVADWSGGYLYINR
jgi:hypothetical protein